MHKKLLIFLCVASSLLTIPAFSSTTVNKLGVAEVVDEQTPVISVKNNAVTIQGGNGLVLEVVSLTGRSVATYKIESPTQRIELNLPKGCYILKVGKTIRKVTLH